MAGGLPQARAQDATAVAAPNTASPRDDVARFSARVESLLAGAGPAKNFWGVLVADAGTGEWLYALNPYRYFQPGSNAKLFTTAYALATLGSDFRVRTTIESAAGIDSAGRLRGDLVLVGRGDANLSNRVFPYEKAALRDGPPDKALAAMADDLVAHGLKTVDGDILADDSAWAPERFPPGWTIDDSVWSYGAAVSALAVNDNTMTLEVRPGRRAGAPLAFALSPQSGRYSVHNTATTSPADTEPQLVLARDPDSRVIRLSGTLPAGSAPRELALAVPEPAEQAAALLARLLADRGVHVTGRPRARHADDPGGARAETRNVLAERLSPPLAEDVKLTNKLSVNLHAELLLRLAADKNGGAPTLDDALKTAGQFYAGAGIVSNEVLLHDGSGLSRGDLVTPRAVVELLNYASHQPWGAEFAASLPVAGEDGTLDNRMKETAAAGRVLAKTGMIDHVEGLSGYATTVRGERLVFALFGNNTAGSGRDATDLLDALCVAMVEELGPPARAVSGQQ